MEIKIKFYRDDKTGTINVKAEPPNEIIGEFITSEIANSISYCQQLIKIVDKVTTTKFSENIDANTFSLIITPDEIIIGNQFNDSLNPFKITAEGFRKILIDYRNFYFIPLTDYLKERDDLDWQGLITFSEFNNPEQLIYLLTEALQNGNQQVASKATDILMELGAITVPALINTLQSDNKHARWFAARTLGNLVDPRGLEPLIKALQDKDNDVRWMVINSLGKVGNKEIIPLLEQIAQNDRNKTSRGLKLDKAAKIAINHIEPAQLR
jgi:uncharacterized protein YacL (UPF0231 family)